MNLETAPVARRVVLVRRPEPAPWPASIVSTVAKLQYWRWVLALSAPQPYPRLASEQYGYWLRRLLLELGLRGVDPPLTAEGLAEREARYGAGEG